MMVVQRIQPLRCLEYGCVEPAAKRSNYCDQHLDEVKERAVCRMESLNTCDRIDSGVLYPEAEKERQQRERQARKDESADSAYGFLLFLGAIFLVTGIAVWSARFWVERLQ